jgi:hypothetical protein
VSAPSPYRPPRRRRDRVRLAVTLSIVGVVAASVLVWLVTDFAAERPDEVNLGDDTFVVGDAKRLAARIDQQREPFLFKDPLTSKPGREVYVQHVGRDHRRGWVAIEAYAPGAPRSLRCILRWDQPQRSFVDPCAPDDGMAAYPADGTGLRTYPAKVNADGDVEVDLRATG